MAVLALGFAGQAIGGAIGGSILGVSSAAIGGFIGSTIGGLVDNMLFGGTRVEGPRLDDRRVSVSSYGVTLPVIYGPENRIGGVVIWSTGLIETVKKTKQGGKGGPSVTTTEYSYRLSCAVAVADRRCRGIKKIWANQVLIYDRDGTGSPPVQKSVFAAMRFYQGDGSQMPDPTIEAYQGVGNAPAYRHTAYFVLEDLQLADFGNRLPNLEVLLEADEEISLTDVVLDLCRRGGLDTNTVSTAALPAANVRGYAIAGSARGTDALQPLALVYSFDAADQGGNLRCVRRGRSPQAALTLDDMGAYQGFDSEIPEPIRYDLMPPTALPREAVLTYADPDRDHQRASQPSRRQFGYAENNLSTEVAVVIDADTARQTADRMLFEAWTGRRTAAWTTSPRWRAAKAGDSYIVPGPEGPLAFRLTRLMRGANGILEWETRQDDAVIYQSGAQGVTAAIPPQAVVGIPLVEIILLDTPLLLDEDDGRAEGFYWGMVANGDGWRGAAAQRAITTSDPFGEFDTQGAELTVGVGLTSLDAIPGGYDSATDWDDDSTLTVRLRREDMTLDSLTDAEVLAGGNAAYIGPVDGHGGEIIQFANAVLQPNGTYVLSRFRRGQKGTEFLATAHGTGQLFVALEPGALRRTTFGLSDLNQSRAYRAVALLQSPDDAPVKTWTNTGAGLRPYAPVDLMADRPGSPSGPIVMNWTRRSRVGWPAMNPPPLAEETEAYVLRIMNAAGTVVVREVNLTTPEYSYSEADQIADFGSPPASLRWRVAQVSAVYGPGVFAERNAGV